MLWVGLAIAAALTALLYGWLEAGWLRCRVLEVEVPRLPAALDGLRVAHLSDFHFGAPLSLGNRASSRAGAWAAAQAPELVCITGDLVSHPRGATRLRSLLALFDGPLVVLGNHDVSRTRDPFSRAGAVGDLGHAVLLRHDAKTVELRGMSAQVVGVDASAYPLGEADPERLVDAASPFRMLLCHFPGILRRVTPGAFHVVLSGHLHAGQIVVPLPRRKLALAHLRSPYVSGLYRLGDTVMHVSPGTGTTFVPFRFFARPEVTLLVLRAPAS